MNEEKVWPELQTIRQTAARAKAEGMSYITETAIRRWIAEGLLRVVPVGNRNLIYWDSLLAFIREGVEVTAAASGLPRPKRDRGRGRKTHTV